MNDQTATPLRGEPALALLKYAIATLLMGPILTMLALGPALFDKPVNYIGPASMLSVALLGWLFLALGYAALAASTLVYGVSFCITGIAVFTGGGRSPVIIVFPVLILIYGWLSETRAVIRVVVLITALNLALWALDHFGLLPVAAMIPPSIYVIHAVLAIISSAVLIALILNTNRRQLYELQTMGQNLTQHTTLLEQNTQLLERAQEVAKVGSWVADFVANTVTPSAQGCQILGLQPGTGTGYSDYLARVHEDDRAAMTSAWQAAQSTGFFDDEHRIVVNGSIRWVRQRAELEFGPDGHPVSGLGIVQDVTVRKLSQLALKESEERHRTLTEWTPEAILVHRNTQILYANPAAIRLFDAPDAASLMAKSTTQLIHPAFLENQKERMKRIESGVPHTPSAESKFITLKGREIDVEVQGTAIQFDNQPAIHVSIRDITDRKQLENEIRQLAFYDILTKLPNRRLLNDRLGQAISAHRRSHCFGALMFLDLDNFKPLNDRYGHSAGDLLLVEAATRLKNCIREMDTVARFGGDEFVILLTELDVDWDKSREYAQTVANKIKATLAAPYVLQIQGADVGAAQIEHRCSASIGVVVFSSEDAHPDELTKWADAAMYQAKKNGRDQIYFASETS